MNCLVGIVFRGILLAYAIGLSQASWSQDFPSRPVRFVVTTGPGVQPDILTRYVANRLSERTGWTTIVDNKPGGNFMVGIQSVLQAPADGYTVLLAIGSMTLLPFSRRDLQFDLLKELSPIARIANGSGGIALSTTVPAKNLAELVAYSKANPGKLSFGAIGGNGAIAHLTLEFIKLTTGLDATVIPYKDASSVMVDLAAGRIHMTANAISEYLNLLREGKIRVLMVNGSKRSPVLPEVPTGMEATGNADYDTNTFYGFMTRAGAPRRAIEQLERELLALAQTAQFRDQLSKMNLEPLAEDSQGFRKKLESDLRRWEKVIRDAKIRFD